MFLFEHFLCKKEFRNLLILPTSNMLTIHILRMCSYTGLATYFWKAWIIVNWIQKQVKIDPISDHFFFFKGTKSNEQIPNLQKVFFRFYWLRSKKQECHLLLWSHVWVRSMLFAKRKRNFVFLLRIFAQGMA